MAAHYLSALNNMIITNSQQDKHLNEFLLQIKERSDRLMNYFLGVYFVIGLVLATYYDTWLIGIGVGSLSLLAYYSSKLTLPNSNQYQYVLSTVFGIFMAQFIYQMHGMFEMHFFAFVGSAILITYQNWKLQIPLALVVVIHHATFGYLQYIGYDQIYFTQLPWMTLETFIIHGFLVTLIFALCGLWAYNFKKFNESHITQSFEIGQLQEADKQKEAIISERKLAEEAIMRSEQRYRLVSESPFLAINWVSPEAKIINTNDTFCKMLGYTRDEILHRHFADFSHPEDVQRDMPFIEKMKRGEIQNYQTEKRFITKYNQIIWAKLNLSSIRNELGEQYRIAIIQDITSRKNAEEKSAVTQAELEKTLKELEERVEERTLDITITNKALRTEVEERVELARMLEAKNKDITDSIAYAQRLQRALFPDKYLLKKYFEKSFIFNKPLHIVGGDFYWFHSFNDIMMIACVDCTGHGVPGAFMSVVGIDMLNKISGDHEVKNPAEVLRLVDEGINKSIGLGKQEGVKDGMDMAYCQIDPARKKIFYSGAMNPIVLISSGKIKIFKGNRFGIGGYMESSDKHFTTEEIPYEKGDMLYMFTDGYIDQLGGINDKKFMLSRLVTLLEKIHLLPGKEQKDILAKTFEDWKGTSEQTDDVMVMGMEL